MKEEVVLWRRVQVRQAFRLALEALFEWMIGEIGSATLTTEALARDVLDEAGLGNRATAREWLDMLVGNSTDTVVGAMEELQSCLQSGEQVGFAALTALAVSVLSDSDLNDRSDRRERLPIGLAAADLERLGHNTPERFLSHVIESWIIAQHT